MLYPTKDIADIDEKLDLVLRRIRDTAIHYAEKVHPYQSQLNLDSDEGNSNSGEHAGSDLSGDNKLERQQGGDEDDAQIANMGVDWSSQSDSDADKEFSVSDQLSKSIHQSELPHSNSSQEPHKLAGMRAWMPPWPLLNWNTVLRCGITIATWDTTYRCYFNWHTSLCKCTANLQVYPSQAKHAQNISVVDHGCAASASVLDWLYFSIPDVYSILWLVTIPSVHFDCMFKPSWLMLCQPEYCLCLPLSVWALGIGTTGCWKSY